MTRQARLLVLAVLAVGWAASAVAGCSTGAPALQPVTHVSRAAARTVASAAAKSPARTVSRSASPRRVPCAGNKQGRLVLVSVRQQHAWMCAGSHRAYDTAVTTGAVNIPDDATPTGTFRIQDRTRHQVLTLASGAQYKVRYWIPFQAPLYGFHDSPWQTMPYGSSRYRTQGSHGCIHLPLAGMRFLYRWAHIGTTVRISRG